MIRPSLWPSWIAMRLALWVLRLDRPAPCPALPPRFREVGHLMGICVSRRLSAGHALIEPAERAAVDTRKAALAALQRVGCAGTSRAPTSEIDGATATPSRQ
jgi:hypothetical protein